MDGRQRSLSFVALVRDRIPPPVGNTALNLSALRRVIHSHHLGAIGTRSRSASLR